VTSTAALTAYLQTYFPHATPAQVSGLVSLYPEDPSAGSPFRTGPLNELYPGFKRNAALLGDVTFTLKRRVMLNQIASTVKCWSYLASYLYGTAFLGTFHASDLQEIYQGIPDPIPAETIRSYYIAFTNTLDPNGLGTAAPLIQWPQYHTTDRSLMNFNALYSAIIPDTFRDNVVQFLQGQQAAFAV